MITPIAFRIMTENDLKQITTFVHSSKFLPGRLLTREVGREAVNNHAIAIFQTEMANAGQVYGIFKDRTLQAVILLKDLVWDSRIYNKKMASIEYTIHNESADHSSTEILHTMLEQIEAVVRDQNYDFLLCKAYTNHVSLIHALQQSEYLLVDTLLDYAYDYSRLPINEIGMPDMPPQLLIRDAETDDLDALLSLSETAFETHYGRTLMLEPR